MKPFPFNSSEHMVTLAQLTNEEAGAWVRLVCALWEKGPMSETCIVRLTGEDNWKNLSYLFTQNGFVSLDWMEDIRTRQQIKSKVNSRNAKMRRSKTPVPVAIPANAQRSHSVRSATAPPVEMKFPAWAGEKTKQMWEQFKTYRAGQHKFKYKTSASEQQAINLLGRYFKNGKECVIALEHTMAKGWMFPVDPSEYKYPSAEEVQQYKFTPQE